MTAVLMAGALLVSGCGEPTAERGFHPAAAPADDMPTANAPTGDGPSADAPTTDGPSTPGADQSRTAEPSRNPLSATTSPQNTTALPSPGVETIDLGSGLRVEIEWPAEPDPQRMAMIKPLADSYLGQWQAVGNQGADWSYLLRGARGEAMQQLYDRVRKLLTAKQSARGVARLYRLRVSRAQGRGAEVTGCVDESGLRLTGRNGDPVANQPDWTKKPTSTHFQIGWMRRGDDGAWRLEILQRVVHPEDRAKECVR